MSAYFYLCGCIIALIILLLDYTEANKKYNVDTSEAIGIFAIGTLLSWLTVILYILEKIFKDN